MFIKEPKIVLRDLNNMSRQQLGMITGFLTGHWHLEKHQHTIGISDTPMCRKCNEIEETLYYLLCECDSMNTLKQLVL